jgi:hypothetical protein
MTHLFKPIDWTELEPQIKPLRERGLSVELIAEELGVDVGTFRTFRRRTGYRIAPIPRSKPNLIGRTE